MRRKFLLTGLLITASLALVACDCESDADCNEGEICQENGDCAVIGGGGNVDGGDDSGGGDDCGDGYILVDDECVPDTGGDDGGDGGGDECDPACDEGEICNEGVCEPDTGCNWNEDCPVDYFCNSLKECEEDTLECRSNLDCNWQIGESCISGTCALPHPDDAACGWDNDAGTCGGYCQPGDMCLSFQGGCRCVEQWSSCEDSSECPIGQTCQDGSCETACGIDSDCGADAQCVNDRCVTYPCMSNSDCQEGYACDQENYCAEIECTSHDDCTGIQSCINGICVDADA